MDRGRDLGQVEQHVRQQLVHGAGHLEDEGGERHDAALVAGAGAEAALEAPDQLTLQIVLQILVVARQRGEDGVDGAVELGPAELGRGVDGRQGVGGEEEFTQRRGEHRDVVAVPTQQPFVLQRTWKTF